MVMMLINILVLFLCYLLLLLKIKRLEDKLLDCYIRRLLRDVDVSSITVGEIDASLINIVKLPEEKNENSGG